MSNNCHEIGGTQYPLKRALVSFLPITEEQQRAGVRKEQLTETGVCSQETNETLKEQTGYGS